ncbi:hypothetical protein HPB50_001395 [Hyalomma asiaticum]|uniref:Uncharacterized protein n=1 Tax=Hyalomma asiaticum TaxID=266040 RepID=A0ACB7SGT6_HYAAI|nr:hypothetical protein HPB50_001395 [Hyalomma asiaticum]
MIRFLSTLRSHRRQSRSVRSTSDKLLPLRAATAPTVTLANVDRPSATMPLWSLSDGARRSKKPRCADRPFVRIERRNGTQTRSRAAPGTSKLLAEGRMLNNERGQRHNSTAQSLR